jgi:hypothetical protein
MNDELKNFKVTDRQSFIKFLDLLQKDCNTRNVTCKLKKKRIFGTRNANDKKDFSIRVYDHEYGGDLDGLSEKDKDIGTTTYIQLYLLPKE